MRKIVDTRIPFTIQYNSTPPYIFRQRFTHDSVLDSINNIIASGFLRFFAWCIPMYPFIHFSITRAFNIPADSDTRDRCSEVASTEMVYVTHQLRSVML